MTFISVIVLLADFYGSPVRYDGEETSGNFAVIENEHSKGSWKVAGLSEQKKSTTIPFMR